MDYLINSSVILFALWTFYKLVLENTSWHHFKRAFLLGSLICAAIIPLIVVRTIIVPAKSVMMQLAPEFEITGEELVESSIQINWTWVLLGVYAVGGLVMLFRLIRNLYQLRMRSTDQVIDCSSYKLILRKKEIVPHSFFNRIYVSAHDYENGHLPQVVIDHEKAHMDQRHSLDILLIELLTIVLWWNPLIYLLKFSIKLNHEFLADRAVLEQHQDTQTYQKTLLSYTAKHQIRTIANTFNFPIIKKRFTIMNTHTTKASGLLRSLAIVPLLTFLVISCGQEEIVEEPVIIEVVEEPQVLSSKTIAIEADSKRGKAWVNGSEYRYERVNGNIRFYDKQGEVIDFKNQGYEILEVDEIEEMIIEVVEDEIVEKPEILMIISEADITKYNELARKHSRLLQDKNRSIYLKDDTKLMQTIWKNMSPEQRRNAEPWPYTGIDGNKAGEIAPPPPPAPERFQTPPPPPASTEKNLKQALNSSLKTLKYKSEGAILYAMNMTQKIDSTRATKEMMDEYNKMIEQSYDGKNWVFINVDLKRMTRIYAQMSLEQKNSVEKLPTIASFNLKDVQPNKPSKKQFESWKNKAEYAVWIDGKVVNNLKTTNLNSQDIQHYHLSKVYKNARSSKFPQPFQVNLYTKDGFQKVFRNKVEVK